MSVPSDLLAHARQLAILDLRRPKQVNLRRAISAAYYSLFHLLVDAASSAFVAREEWNVRIGRMLKHGDMKKVSALFSKHQPPKLIQPGGSGYRTPDSLKIVTDAFVTLQEARHEADYDFARRPFTRQVALDLIDRTQEAMEAWEVVKKSDDAKLYLHCFLLWEKWDKSEKPS